MEIEGSPVVQSLDHGQMVQTYIQMTLVTFIQGAIIGGIMYFGNVLYNKLYKMLWCTVEFDSQDESYEWVMKFILDKGFVQDTAQLSAKQKIQKEKWWESYFKSDDTKKRPEAEYLPGVASHSFNYDGISISLQLNQGKKTTVGWDNKPVQLNTLVLSARGKKIHVLKKFVDEAVEHNSIKEGNQIGIYEQHPWGIGWYKVQTKKARPLNSIILDQDIAKDIQEDIIQFQKSPEWYHNKGIPYRRGYLLYGPPGTGKTSFTEAIAGQLKLNICYLNMTSQGINDDDLNEALNSTPPNSIILLEDIDALFVARESVLAKNGAGTSISFSGLLNALDGVRSQEGRIVFMTTNHREKLDPALLRPGRADVHVQLNNASEKQMKGMFLKFYPNQEQKAQEFANELPEFQISMAKLQGHFLKYRDDIDAVIRNVEELKNEEQKINEMSVFEWLDRLNMSQYVAEFYKKNMRRVSDLQYLAGAAQCGVTKIMDASRINGMLRGNKQISDNFKYLSNHEARTIIQTYWKNSDKIEELISLIPNDSITGFQLRDILEENKSITKVIKKIQKRVESNLNKNKETFIDETTEKDKKPGIPDYDIEKLLKEFDLKDKIPKLKEHDIDPPIFWELDESQLESLLDVKVYGKKKLLWLKIQEIKKKNEEAFAKSLLKKTSDKDEPAGANEEDEEDEDQEDLQLDFPKLFKNKSLKI